MALETLKDVEEIGGFETDRGWDSEVDSVGSESYPVWIDDKENMIAFKIQDGPIKESGVNGCQVDTIIEAAKLMLRGLNEKVPSDYNATAITKLEDALFWLDQRRKSRVSRGVEGTQEK